MNWHRRKQSKGFSLLELVIVVVIIGIIAAIAIPRMSRGSAGAADAALTGDLAGLHKLRVGDYRVVYEVLHSEQTIIVHLVGHRRDIYRRR